MSLLQIILIWAVQRGGEVTMHLPNNYIENKNPPQMGVEAALCWKPKAFRLRAG